MPPSGCALDAEEVVALLQDLGVHVCRLAGRLAVEGDERQRGQRGMIGLGRGDERIAKRSVGLLLRFEPGEAFADRGLRLRCGRDVAGLAQRRSVGGESAVVLRARRRGGAMGISWLGVSFGFGGGFEL